MIRLPDTHFMTYDMGERVTAFSTLRSGGVSKGNYASFNVNPYGGDSSLCVAENVRILCRALHIGPDELVMPHQVHGNRVKVIDRAFFELSAESKAQYLEGVDGLLTDCPCCIGVSTADCVPLLFYDPSGKAAAVHAGWRGTVAGIAAEAVKLMREVYETEPDRLKVCIGPSISQRAFEVGDEVYEQFSDSGFPMERVAVRIEKRWHIDLWECNRIQLVASGVEPERINVCGECTYSQPERFFSARRLGIRSGRIFSGICLARDGFFKQS